MKKINLYILLLILILMLIVLSSCSSITKLETETPEEEETELVLPDTSSVEIIPAAGGFLMAMDEKGNTVAVHIPPFAVDKSVPASLTILEKPPENPFKNSILAGFILEPHGLKLKRPADITITFKEIAPGEDAFIFYVPSYAGTEPVPRTEVKGNVLKGSIYHFSSYTASDELTPEEWRELNELSLKIQIKFFRDYIKTPPGMTELFDFLQLIDSLEAWAKGKSNFGDASDIYNLINGLVDKAAAAILRESIPSDPCGIYKEAMVLFAPYLSKYSINGANITGYRQLMEDVFSKCPIKGELKMYIDFFHGLPIDVVMVMTDPIPFRQEEDNKITGGGPNRFIMDWVQVQDRESSSIHGEISGDFGIEGEIRITEELKAQIVFRGKGGNVNGYFDFKIGMASIMVIPFTGTTTGGTTNVHATAYTPLGVFLTSGSSSDPPPKDLVLPYRNGAVWIKSAREQGVVCVCRLVIYFSQTGRDVIF